jgi:hypothetical protein
MRGVLRQTLGWLLLTAWCATAAGFWLFEREIVNAVPSWDPFLVSMSLVLATLAFMLWGIPGEIRKARARRRTDLWLCPSCGYDLRAHGEDERCPECGTVRAASDL